jgi:hypothetical protein
VPPDRVSHPVGLGHLLLVPVVVRHRA